MQEPAQAPTPEPEQQSITTAQLAGLIITIIVTIICSILITKLQPHKHSVQVATDDRHVHINVGALGYTFSNGRAYQRNDANITSLKGFLTATARKDIQLGCKDAYYSVIAANSSETQVFLRYGCDSPDSPMHAIKSRGSWELVSPTNHFDQFGIPDCTYTDQYVLDIAVAPVCVSNMATATPQYLVRH